MIRATKSYHLHPWQCAWGYLVLALTLASPVAVGSRVARAAENPSAIQQQPLKERQRIAADMFRERCKKAGVFIHRTVENVEGVILMKLRPQGVNFDEQYVLDDPYGNDVNGEGYIKEFLESNYESWSKINPNPSVNRLQRGYAYVEAIDPKDGVRYRYTGSLKAVRQKKIDAPNVQLELRRNPNYDLNIYDYILERTPSKEPPPRYGVIYDDISTSEDRDYWIAGSSLRVIDLQTNEIIAERIGYMVDWAQGSSAGGRSPWLLAANNACPEFAPHHGARAQLGQTIRFVNKSLKTRE